jgi:phage terminase large subunit-like protein
LGTLSTAESDGIEVTVGIEANGTQLGYYDDIADAISNRSVKKLEPDGSKEMRASVWGSRLEDGIIHAVRGPWLDEFIDEMDTFPARRERRRHRRDVSWVRAS